MLQCIRKAIERDGDDPPVGDPAEVDEDYLGGLRKNMHRDKRKELTGRGAVWKEVVVGVRGRENYEVRVHTSWGGARKHRASGSPAYLRYR